MAKEVHVEGDEIDVGVVSDNHEAGRQKSTAVPSVPKEYRTWDDDLPENKTY